MPIVIQKGRTFFSLFGLDVNKEFQYPKYFSMQPGGGADPPVSFSKGFFELAMAQNPKPQTVAIIAGDAEFPRNAAEGARKNAKNAGLKVVYDKTYPPNTTDFTPIVRAIDSTNPDLVLSFSYPPDAVGIVRAANEIGLKAKMFGGGLVGLQYASIKQQLGDRLNGVVNYDCWEPAKTLKFPGIAESLKKYQAPAAAEGVDPLGYYLPPFAYANMQAIEQAVEGAKSLDDDKLADWLRKNKLKTIVGDIEYGPNGEWKEPRGLQVPFPDVKGSDLDQWQTDAKQTILWPDKYATGKINYPYAEAKKAGAPATAAKQGSSSQ